VAQLRVEGQARVTLDNCDVAESPEVPAYDVSGGKLIIDGKPYAD
jgi:hypothetical protein